MKKIILLFVLFLGCDAIIGEEIGNIAINALSTQDNMLIKEISLDLNKSDNLSIWSDMDIEYEGQVFLKFKLQVLKEGIETHLLEIDPLKKNISIGESKVTKGNLTTWNFTGKNAEIIIPENGRYVLKAFLVASDNPTLKINKAEIVIRR